MSSHSHSRSAICTGSTVSGAFSALHLLRSYSLLAPPDLCRYEPYATRDYGFSGEPTVDVLQNHRSTLENSASPTSLTTFSLPTTLLQPPLITAMPPLMQSINLPQSFANAGTAVMTRHFVSSEIHKKPRSEKKPIPEEQKDEKYYERRKRNNQAAKKSRDARKIREDHIALRATMLEHENAILRAQITTLREEAQSLRHMLLKQQSQHSPLPRRCSPPPLPNLR